MNKQIKRIKIHIAYILCIAIMPISFILNVVGYFSGAFSYAWKNAKADMQSNNRYYKINMKMLDLS